MRIALFALAVLMIILGVYNGSARDVFGKAVKICTECVGLG
ncbi:MAG TPA: thioredoxin [Lachnospiraceae bacterium]|nr:thioredoxin [Lachnospiraceae bacterium]